jgi:carbonic anhydrase/acetyltransferase-like protein (isoleucine patch superfamily)
MIIERFGKPAISPTAFVAETAVLVGNVEVKEKASIWYGAVLRGDKGKITIGERANVQDNAVVHTTPGEDAYIGEGVTIGHGAIVHGLSIGRYSLVGMGAIILGKATVGEHCIIGAGAVVKEGDSIPAGSLVVGVPGKVVRQLTEEQIKSIEENADEYEDLARKYLEGTS